MNKARKITHSVRGKAVTDGAGVRLMRIFGYREAFRFDPFLMLDHFGSDDPQDFIAGFPWHPHRGIEAITYMREGSAEHKDSLGHSGTIHKGELQWMTAGSGIIHQEMPKPNEKGSMYGFQLWTNLPSHQKMMHPRYRDISQDSIPSFEDDKMSIKIVSGSFLGLTGPVKDIVTEPHYYIVELKKGNKIQIPVQAEHTCLIFCFTGSLKADDQRLEKHQISQFEDGDHVYIQASDEDGGFLFLSGKPLKEPIAWGGPIVMNTKDELNLAFEELDKGTFIKHS